MARKIDRPTWIRLSRRVLRSKSSAQRRAEDNTRAKERKLPEKMFYHVLPHWSEIGYALLRGDTGMSEGSDPTVSC